MRSKYTLLAVVAIMAIGLLVGHAVPANEIVIGAAALHASPDMLGGLAFAPLAIGSVSVEEIKSLIEGQGRAWEEFKKTNDQRIKAIEEKGNVPAELEAKLGKIDADLTKKTNELVEIQKKINRPDFGSEEGKGLTPEMREYKQAFGGFLRKGHEDGLRDLEQKALSAGSDPDGGYIILPEMDVEIDRIAMTISAMRQVANVRTIGSAAYKKLVKTRGVSGGWLAEAADSSESTENQWSMIEIKVEKMYAEPWVPNEMLEDAFYDLEQDLMGEAGITFAETEGTAFINGTGNGQPRGILGYSAVANASYAWGKVGYIASGKSGAFASSAPSDKFIDLQHALKPQYRPGAVWMMSDATLGTARQMKDASGQYYLWQPDATGEFSGRFLGHGIVTDDNMPTIAANSYSVAFGNFKRGYTIADRSGTAIIRDPYTKKGVTKFHLTRRVGGGITNFEAIKLMKFATS